MTTEQILSILNLPEQKQFLKSKPNKKEKWKITVDKNVNFWIVSTVGNSKRLLIPFTVTAI